MECIVTGHKAASQRSIIVREYLATGLGRFKCDDGHLPDYQPVVSEIDALRFLDANPFQAITEVKQ